MGVYVCLDDKNIKYNGKNRTISSFSAWFIREPLACMLRTRRDRHFQTFDKNLRRSSRSGMGRGLLRYDLVPGLSTTQTVVDRLRTELHGVS